MRKFMEWLSVEAKGVLPVIGYAMFAALIVISLDYTVKAALINWGVFPKPQLPKAGENPFQYYNIMMFLGLFVWSPIKEEIFHRVVPLGFVTAFVSQTPAVVFGLNVLFAVVFGTIHPYGPAGKILVGIGGFFFGLVFLKCGGLNRSYIKASAAAMLAHGFTNMLVILDSLWDYYELTL